MSERVRKLEKRGVGVSGSGREERSPAMGRGGGGVVDAKFRNELITKMRVMENAV